MLLDTISLFIGFVGIMLVLSLIVTALVQFLQSALGLRARNLRLGVQSLIESVLHDIKTGPTEAGQSEQSEVKGATVTTSAKALTKEVLEESQFIPKSEAPGPIASLLSPASSWVEQDELIEHLKKSGVALGKAEQERFSLLFRRMEAYLDKRFALSIRLITIVCAILVAGYFQVSTPELLKKLSTNPRYRAAAAKASEEIYGEAGPLMAASTNYQNVSDIALAELTTKHPNRAAYLERASGLGENRAEIVGELQSVLEPLPSSERAQIVAEYEQLLANLQEKAAKTSGEQLEFLADKLSAYDITPWTKDWSYFTHVENIIGVLVTAMFLTFGTPFWYERLRELIQLRDALTPKPEKTENASSQKTDKN